MKSDFECHRDVRPLQRRPVPFPPFPRDAKLRALQRALQGQALHPARCDLRNETQVVFDRRLPVSELSRVSSWGGAYRFRLGDPARDGMPRMIRWPRKTSNQKHNC